MASDQVITLELQAIVGTLRLAHAALERVNGQKPPGPPDQPAQVDALNNIVKLSSNINQLATTMLGSPAGGGGTPGTP